MSATTIKHRLLETPGDFAVSRLQSRTSFLNLVLQLRPHVVSHLWEVALPEFTTVVLRRFHQEIFGDLEGAPRHSESIQEDLLEAPTGHYAFQILLLQQKLAPRLLVAESDLVRETFRYWASLKGRENRDLRERIRKLSRTWNLDADWCRDHAVNVLREWLFSPNLSRLHVSPLSQQPLEAEGWGAAVGEIAFDAEYSREFDERVRCDFASRRSIARLIPTGEICEVIHADNSDLG